MNWNWFHGAEACGSFLSPKSQFIEKLIKAQPRKDALLSLKTRLNFIEVSVLDILTFILMAFEDQDFNTELLVQDVTGL